MLMLFKIIRGLSSYLYTVDSRNFKKWGQLPTIVQNDGEEQS